MDNIIEFEVTTTIQIDLANLVDETGLGVRSTAIDIKDAVDNYIMGLDDTEYYLLGPGEIDIVAERVREYLDSMNRES